MVGGQVPTGTVIITRGNNSEAGGWRREGAETLKRQNPTLAGALAKCERGVWVTPVF